MQLSDCSLELPSVINTQESQALIRAASSQAEPSLSLE